MTTSLPRLKWKPGEVALAERLGREGRGASIIASSSAPPSLPLSRPRQTTSRWPGLTVPTGCRCALSRLPLQSCINTTQRRLTEPPAPVHRLHLAFMRAFRRSGPGVDFDIQARQLPRYTSRLPVLARQRGRSIPSRTSGTNCATEPAACTRRRPKARAWPRSQTMRL